MEQKEQKEHKKQRYYQPQTSKYLPIWNALKNDKQCRITAPPIYHKTIIKMVKNRRDKDTAFLFDLSEQNLTHKIKYKVSGSVIHFKLIIEATLRGL